MDKERDATNEELEEEVVEEVVEETVEEEESKSSILDTIKEKVFGKKEEKEETEPEIPEEFLVAAEGQFSEEEIKKLADEYSADELKKLVPFLLEEEKEEETAGTETKEELVEVDEENLKQVEKLQAALDAAEKYSERINALEERLKAVDDERVVKEEEHRQELADTFFDKASKKLPVFGETEKLMRFPDGHANAGQIIPIGSAFEARQAVWAKAQQFAQLGDTWSDSLDDALAWYKGKHGEKELKEQMVKDLKKNEQRLSPKRSSTETKETYADAYQEKLAVIEEAKKKAGIV